MTRPQSKLLKSLTKRFAGNVPHASRDERKQRRREQNRLAQQKARQHK